MDLSVERGILVSGSQDKTVFFCSLSKLTSTEGSQTPRKEFDKDSPLIKPIGFISMTDEVRLRANQTQKKTNLLLPFPI